MATETAQLPHLIVFDRVLGLPVIESALAKSAETYSKVKGSHQLLRWLLSTAEISLNTARKQAVPIAVPIAKRLENPINFVDDKLCLGLDKIEEKVPIVKETPEQILINAYTLAIQTVAPAVSSISYVNELILAQATNLRDISWSKANQILDTYYGSVAVKGLDNTAAIVDKLIDRYFPATEEEKMITVDTVEQDKLLHTLQTVGRLSNKAARRVYSNVMYHLRIIKKDNLMSYISSLVEFLQITRYLHTVDHKVQEKINGAEKEEPKEEKKKLKEEAKKTN